MTDIKFIGTNQVELVNSLNENDKLPSFDTGEDFIEFKFTDPLSNNDVDYYHFVITGSNVQVSGVIDSVSKKQEFCNLFKGCTQITDASNLILSAPTMKESCYANMFIDCTNLTTPPQIQAQTLDMWCFQNMFAGCTSLTSAPRLPASTLAPYCYYAMFYNCRSLSTAPVLTASTLVDWCYNSMFYNCTSLNSISANFTEWKGNATSSWVTNVAESGNFENDNVEKIYSNSNIPISWKIDYSALPLTFKSTGNTTVKINKDNLSYSVNGGEWTTYNSFDTISLSDNDEVAFSGTNSAINTNFITTGDGTLQVYGNPHSLINWGNLYQFYCFQDLFSGCVNIVDASNLILSAMNLGNNSYRNMFYGCNLLTGAPQLPATGLTQFCYDYMFYRCSSLSTAPNLPATTLANRCYAWMFAYCTSLSTAPDLPATTLAAYCYDGMFWECSKLNNINVNFYNWDEFTNSTTNWVYGVANEGTFIKPTGLAEKYGTSRIPVDNETKWTVINK